MQHTTDVFEVPSTMRLCLAQHLWKQSLKSATGVPGEAAENEGSLLEYW